MLTKVLKITLSLLLIFTATCGDVTAVSPLTAEDGGTDLGASVGKPDAGSGQDRADASNPNVPDGTVAETHSPADAGAVSPMPEAGPTPYVWPACPTDTWTRNDLVRCPVSGADFCVKRCEVACMGTGFDEGKRCVPGCGECYR